MFRTRCFALSAFTTILLFPNWLAAATTWYVDKNHSNCCVLPSCSGTSSAPFCTIEDGVSAASDGDTVLVAPSLPGPPYAPPGFDLRISKNIVLKSAGTDPQLPPLQRAEQTIIQKSVHFRPGDDPGRCIEGLTITSPIGSATVGIQLTNCAAQIVGKEFQEFRIPGTPYLFIAVGRRMW